VTPYKSGKPITRSNASEILDAVRKAFQLFQEITAVGMCVTEPGPKGTG